MTALAEASAGLALVMSVALLCTWRIGAAAIVLAAQSAAVALTAALLHQPLLALPPLLFAGVLLAGRNRTTAPEPPAGSVARGIAAGAVLTVLCLSHDGLALPLAIVLLAILFAATRPHPPLQVMALIALQNGLVLAGCLVVEPAILAPVLLPVICLVLPLPLAAHLLIPAETQWRTRSMSWLGRIDLALSIAMLAATLIVPIDGLASVFAPLLGFDAVVRSCARRKRYGLAPPRRVFALLQAGFVLLAVCASNVIVAWLAIFGAMAAFLLPRLRTGSRPPTGAGRFSSGAMTISNRPKPTPAGHWDEAGLAFAGAGIALFGLLMLSSLPSVTGYFSVFAGFTAIAAIVPDLAVVLVILLLRLASQSQWPAGAEAVGTGIALIAVLACSLRLINPTAPHRATLLQLGQCGIALLAVCSGEADGRFAALVLLVLLILTRSAARITGGIASTLALAGLAGVPPLGVFPGLVLVAMALGGNEPWLLLPLGAALVPIILGSLPRHPVVFELKAATPSLSWLPLAVALLAGYLAPSGLVHWWHLLTAGNS